MAASAARCKPSAAGSPSAPITPGAWNQARRSTRPARSSAAAMPAPPSASTRVTPRCASAASSARRSSPPSGAADTVCTATPAAMKGASAAGGWPGAVTMQAGAAVAVIISRAPGGVRSRASATTRSIGTRSIPGMRQVRSGSSASTVPEPTSTASCRARSAWTARRASGPVIQRLSPAPVAMRPSRVVASFSVTSGSPASIRRKKPAFSARASAASRPSSTGMAASRRRARPRPSTRGSGSRMATTTRAMPAASSASQQGGVRPWWEQGSSVT